MNDEQVIERVRSAIESQVAGVHPEVPELTERYASAEPEPVARRSRWLLPIGLAAAAAVVLGVVLVSRGDDRNDVDVPENDQGRQAPDGLERWVLDADGAVLVAADDATTSATAMGTSVYYRGSDGTMTGAVARTNGVSIGLARSSWPVLETVDLLGTTATRYSDGHRELLVVSTTPPLIVETYGAMDAVALARTAQPARGVWVLASGDIEEIGRRTEQSGPLRFSYLEYQVGGVQQNVTVVRHPAGVIGSLLDTGLYPERRVTDPSGTMYLVVGPSTAVLDRTSGDVVTVDSPQEGGLLIPSDRATLRQVDEAAWLALVSVVRPDLGDPNVPVPTIGVVATTAPGPTATYQAIGTVIEVAGKSLELCLGGVMESLPPQCDGIPIDPVAWRWPDGTFDQSRGVRWAEYVVVGTYDGTTFTPSEDPRVPTDADRAARPQVAQDFSTPCPAPEGGWLAAAAKAPTGADAEAALTALADYRLNDEAWVGMWLDQSINPAFGSSGPDVEASLNDPTKYVVNVAFAGDIEEHEAALAEIWSGALCVSRSEGRPLRMLESYQTELTNVPGLLSSWIDETTGTLHAEFVLVTPELRVELDERFGAGAVVATSALVAVDA